MTHKHYIFIYFIEINDLCVCVCREIRNVELLKLRFGESHMHYCEVMLKVRAVSNSVNFLLLLLHNYR